LTMNLSMSLGTIYLLRKEKYVSISQKAITWINSLNKMQYGPAITNF
jgi:hypothetical protein